MNNLSLFYYKEYYKELGCDSFKSKDEDKKHDEGTAEKNLRELVNTTFVHDRDYQEAPVAGCQTFILRTLYPGLLIGIGIPHGAGKLGDNDYDVKLGFSFDYVTGQPVIPGSSVKGVLRSHFQYRTVAVTAILRQLGFPDVTDGIVRWDKKKDNDCLEKAIFENSDVFFDAVVFDGDEYSNLVGTDYITPHTKPTQNPIPVQILKIMPGVRMEFRFKLSEKTVCGITFTEDVLIKLFQELLVLFGAGAKTNVGYGVFEPADDKEEPKKKREPKKQKEEAFQKATQNSNRDKIKCPHCGFFNFRYNKSGTRENTWCYKCRNKLK